MDYAVSIAEIILVNLVLSGDNAIVIALATRNLNPQHRRRAVIWGGAVAIIARIAFTAPIAYLVTVPGLRLLGGIALALIACKLLLDDSAEATAEHAENAWSAIRTIFLADIVMSLDNMLAVAGASRGDPILLAIGLVASMVMIITCSTLIAQIMDRFKWLAYAGTGVLAFAAAELMSDDLSVCLQAAWFAGHWRDLAAQRMPATSWAFYAMVLSVCLTSPRWWPRKQAEPWRRGRAENGPLSVEPEFAAALSVHVHEETSQPAKPRKIGPFYRRLFYVEQPADFT